MTDCVLFGALFASSRSCGMHLLEGPPGHELFNLTGVGIEKRSPPAQLHHLRFGALCAHVKNRIGLVSWLVITALLGAGFISLEVREFMELIANGAGP